MAVNLGRKGGSCRMCFGFRCLIGRGGRPSFSWRLKGLASRKHEGGAMVGWLERFFLGGFVG